MPKNTTETLASGAWVEITANDITAVTLQNRGPFPLLVVGTVGQVAPTDDAAAIEIEAGAGWQNELLSEIWPGIAATRIYVKSTGGNRVMISHA